VALEISGWWSRSGGQKLGFGTEVVG